ncbi:MAG: hypothetical protein MPN21_25830, partial [Thermoanaerobaculia bacterium]|nr:hypothetical protein [Thermoanaerobaculia bacterium]
MYRHQALIQYAVTFLLALLTTAALSAEPADRSVKSTSVGADRVEGIESFVQRFGAIDATRPGAEAQRQRLYAEMSRELDLTSPSLFSSDSGDHCKLACEQTNVAIASLDIAKGFASEAVESCADPNFYAAEAKYFADVAYATAVFAADLACKQHPGAASFILNARTRASKAAFEAERSFL